MRIEWIVNKYITFLQLTDEIQEKDNPNAIIAA